MNARYVLLSLAAGLAGGALSSFFHPIAAHAEPGMPDEIRAQRFTLVNQSGAALGSLSFDDLGRPQLILRDRSGHEVWKLVGEHSEDRSQSFGRFHSK
jgi:hypothetical protein